MTIQGALFKVEDKLFKAANTDEDLSPILKDLIKADWASINFQLPLSTGKSLASKLILTKKYRDIFIDNLTPEQFGRINWLEKQDNEYSLLKSLLVQALSLYKRSTRSSDIRQVEFEEIKVFIWKVIRRFTSEQFRTLNLNHFQYKPESTSQNLLEAEWSVFNKIENDGASFDEEIEKISILHILVYLAYETAMNEDLASTLTHVLCNIPKRQWGELNILETVLETSISLVHLCFYPAKNDLLNVVLSNFTPKHWSCFREEVVDNSWAQSREHGITEDNVDSLLYRTGWDSVEEYYNVYYDKYIYPNIGKPTEEAITVADDQEGVEELTELALRAAKKNHPEVMIWHISLLQDNDLEEKALEAAQKLTELNNISCAVLEQAYFHIANIHFLSLKHPENFSQFKEILLYAHQNIYKIKSLTREGTILRDSILASYFYGGVFTDNEGKQHRVYPPLVDLKTLPKVKAYLALCDEISCVVPLEIFDRKVFDKVNAFITEQVEIKTATGKRILAPQDDPGLPTEITPAFKISRQEVKLEMPSDKFSSSELQQRRTL